ncbi:hypothetical protein ACROYT_G028884 [Oculina patagonica]
MPLKDVFEDFRKSKATLVKIHNDTVQYFDEIVGKLSNQRDAKIAVELSYASSPPTSPDEVKVMTQAAALADINLEFDPNLAELLYTSQEKKEVTSLFSQEPALIFVGQTNCGKSSIINEILGCKSLPTSDQPSTARIVRVSYAEKPFCQLVGKDGKPIQEIALKGKNKIPRKKIELSQKDRVDATKVEATVETGLNIEFLKSGVSIIDSPGRNENDALDNLVKEKLENPLAFVIYVVDGHNLFTKQDREVLSEMTSRRPDLPIFFVVSKLEPEDRTESSDEDEEPGGSSRSRIRESEVQSRKKLRVYERLVKHGFLSAENGVDMDQNERFHGLSAWRIQTYNEMKKKNPNASSDDFSGYTEAFDRFQESLKKFAEESLRARVEQVCQILIRVLSRCLDFFIQTANVLKKGKKLMEKTLQTLLQEEREVHDNISRNLDEKANHIQDLLTETFNGAHDGILKEAEKFEYVLTDFTIPQSGFVTQKAAVGHCQDQLQRMVVNKLQGEVKEKLSMMFHSRDLFVTQLKERIEQVEKEITGDREVPSAALALGKSLLSSYEAQITFGKQDGAILRFIKKLAIWFYDAICDPIDTIVNTVTGKVEVGSSKWKTKVASNVLKKVDPSKMAKEIVTNLKAHFCTCHEEFTGEINKVQDLFSRGETISDEQRGKVLEFAPNLALLEMLAYGVMDRFKFGLPRKGDLIGTGAQGSVFACDNITTPEGKPCVVKVVGVASEEVLKDLTLELHNTRSLQHPNILPILCTIVEANPTRSLSASLVSERMRCDLQEGLPAIPSMRKRLEIALDVAKALRYLHAEDLIHRDVKVQNVLLDENNRAKLTDMGLCKPEGLASNSLVGTPINMAPEMIKQQYDKTIDVYAFGMLLWRVCEGKGNQPQNVNRHFLPLVMLMLNALENKTPERLDVFPQSCWDLMEKCWNKEPEARPSFDTVVKALEEILRDASIH